MSRIQRHITRLRQILSVFLKYGLAEAFSLRKYARLVQERRLGRIDKPDKTVQKLPRWERARMAIEELGPTFIKFGQILSSRPDILPPELILELEKLQSAVKPFDSDIAVEIIEKEQGQPIDTIFASFRREPTATGSIAQVHEARLHEGKRVVVKVRRPNIISVVETDLELMLTIVPLVEKVFLRSEVLNGRNIIQEFGRILRNELDFTNEARAMVKLRENFGDNPNLHVPAVMEDYSSSRIITMEYIEGIPASDIDRINSSGYRSDVAAANAAELMAAQIFDHGYFHADPHGGNTFVLPGNRICFLDFGMMGYLMPRQKEILGSVILGIAASDARKIARALVQMAFSGEIQNLDALEFSVYLLLERYLNLPLEKLNVGELLSEMITLLISYSLTLPPNIFVLTKALVAVEGTARKLNPEFNMIKHIEPFARRIIYSRLDPARLGKEVFTTGMEILELLREAPENARDFMSWAKQGKLKLDFDLKGVERILKKGDQITNRLTYSIVLASLVIGSALITSSRIPPLWREIPIIGILGFSSAAVLGIWLFIATLRNN